jgi:hypothetical protein
MTAAEESGVEDAPDSGTGVPPCRAAEEAERHAKQRSDAQSSRMHTSQRTAPGNYIAALPGASEFWTLLGIVPAQGGTHVPIWDTTQAATAVLSQQAERLDCRLDGFFIDQAKL